MNVVELTIADVGKLRKTNDTPPRVSVYDVIAIVTDKSTKDATVYFIRVKEKFPEVVTSVTISPFKFPGQGQRETPVTDIKGVVEILKILPGVAPSETMKWGSAIAKHIGEDTAFVSDAILARSIPKRIRVRDEDAVGRIIKDTGAQFVTQKRAGPFYIDYVITRPWGYMLLEVDEKQHFQYSAQTEYERTLQIEHEFEGFRTCLVRYNPHSFVSDGRKQKVNHATRRRTIQALINDFTPNEMFSIVFLYYDMHNSIPDNVHDIHMPTKMKDCIRVFNYSTMSVDGPLKSSDMFDIKKLLQQLQRENARLRKLVLDYACP